MGGGILIGVFWGLLFTAFVAAVASLNTPLPTRPGAETPAVASEARDEVPEAGTDPAPPPGGEAAPDDEAEGGDAAPADSIPLPSGSEFNRPPPDEAAVLPGTDAAPGIDVPGAPPMPLQTFSGSIDTAPAPRPDVTAAPNAPRAPASNRVAVAPSAGADAPAQTAVQPGPILAPAPDPDASPDTATPDANAPAQGADPLAQPAPVESQASRDPGTRPSTRVPPADMSGASENAAGSGPESPDADVTATAGEPAANEVEGGSVLQFVPPRASGAARSGADADPDGDVPTMSAPSADMTAPSPRILRPGGDDAGDGPRRLPQIVVPGRTEPPGISDAPTSAGATDAAPDGPAEDSPATAEPDDIPAIVAHAAAFDAAETRPLLAVVLIDEPDARLDLQTLTDFSFPVAFAVDPMRPGAADRAAAYRAAGFEVLLLASAIPEGATAGDTEVALAAAARRVPQAVALIDTPESRMQGDRVVLEAAIGVAAGAGQGLLAFPRGLNTAEQMAGREGVPAATLFRLLDAGDESAAAIARQLGRAEFAAVQEGAAVVAGRTRPDTVTALYSWALGNRNEAVAIAPVSAVLMRLSDDD